MAAFSWKYLTRINSTQRTFLLHSRAIPLSTRAALVEKYNLKAKNFSSKKCRYIVDPDLAERVTKKLGIDKNTLVVEANPGPGVLSQALLNSGARRVLALEPDKRFHVALKEIQDNVGVTRFTFHRADFGKIDPHLSLTGLDEGKCIPPAIPSSELFKGVEPIPWESENLVARFVGIESGKQAAALPKILLGCLAQIAARESIFSWGRCELSFFYTQQRAEKVSANRGSRYYNRLSVLVSLLCDVRILHSEPCVMFDPNFNKEREQYLHMISLVPKRDPGLHVTRDELTCISHFVRLLMVKPRHPLAKVIDGIIPGSHVVLDELGWPHDTCVADLTPQDIGKLISGFFQWEGKSLDFFYNAM